ncbi:hypothetical protein EDB86DRAFT_522431 [Lactarius hatsudake]|nr:hypothetical protein EDB86DRAFT_522431 [Lactarius hatsudake]
MSNLEQTRSAHRNRCAVELDVLSPEFTLVALVEFGQVMVKTNSECELAQQKDTDSFRDGVTEMAQKLCKTFFRLCVQFAGGGPITNEVLVRAETFQGDRFKRLALHAMTSVRSALRHSVPNRRTPLPDNHAERGWNRTGDRVGEKGGGRHNLPSKGNSSSSSGTIEARGRHKICWRKQLRPELATEEHHCKTKRSANTTVFLG